jgi:cyclopropane-fatty-acyl-phospholipid synthase
MRYSALKEPLEEILAAAGIAINGPGPSDIAINDDSFFARVISNGSLGLGESYVDGWWECENLDDFFCRLFISDAE